MHILGFSFVELLIAVTIVAILGAIAAPGMMNFVRDNRLSTTANDLISDISLARSEAIKRGIPVVICKTADATAAEGALVCNAIAADAWTSGWLIFVDADDDGLRDTGGTPETLIKVHAALQNGMTLASFANVASNIRFRPSGRPAASAGIGAFPGGTFKLCDARGAVSARAIVVTESGRPRVSDQRNGSGVPLDYVGTAIVCP